jgi:hypothetical protein
MVSPSGDTLHAKMSSSRRRDGKVTARRKFTVPSEKQESASIEKEWRASTLYGHLVDGRSRAAVNSGSHTRSELLARRKLAAKCRDSSLASLKAAQHSQMKSQMKRFQVEYNPLHDLDGDGEFA